MKATRNIGKAIPQPVVYEPDTISLELTIAEAEFLHAMLGRLTRTKDRNGEVTRTPINTQIYHALTDAGIQMPQVDLDYVVTNSGGAYIQING